MSQAPAAADPSTTPAEPAQGEPLEGSKSRRQLSWILLLLVLLVCAGVRARLFAMPLERDEGEYAYAGQLILEGIPPYQVACNMKWPGTYYAYATIEALLGQTPVAVHLGTTLCVCMTIALVFLVGRKLLDDWCAVGAAAAYAVLSVSRTSFGLAGHATHFVVLFAVLGIYLMLIAVRRPRPGLYLLAGFSLGLAMLMKQPGVFFPAFAVLFHAADQLGRFLRSKRGGPTWEWRTALISGSLLGVGIAAPFALVCLNLAREGVFNEFWFWTFTYASHYGNPFPWSWIPLEFWKNFTQVVTSMTLLWGLAGLGLVGAWVLPRYRVYASFLTGWLVFSFLAVCPGFWFRTHYFILMFPMVALLVGIAVSAIRDTVERFRPRLGPPIAIALLLFAVAQTGICEFNFLFVKSPIEACREAYGLSPFVESVPIADFIREHTTPDDSIAVVGSEPQICFYAQRRSATSFIYTYPMMEPQPFARTMQERMIHEILANCPRYIVYVDMHTSWLDRPGSDFLILKWFAQYRAAQLRQVGVIRIPSDPAAIAFNADANSPIPDSNYIQVFERIDRP